VVLGPVRPVVVGAVAQERVCALLMKSRIVATVVLRLASGIAFGAVVLERGSAHQVRLRVVV